MHIICTHDALHFALHYAVPVHLDARNIHCIMHAMQCSMLSRFSLCTRICMYRDCIYTHYAVYYAVPILIMHAHLHVPGLHLHALCSVLCSPHSHYARASACTGTASKRIMHCIMQSRYTLMNVHLPADTRHTNGSCTCIAVPIHFYALRMHCVCTHCPAFSHALRIRKTCICCADAVKCTVHSSVHLCIECFQ